MIAMIACTLGECGYPEAARECELRHKKAAGTPPVTRLDLESILRKVLSQYRT
jgi:hypothetical protein